MFGLRRCGCVLFGGLLVCVVLGVLGYTVLLPRFRDEVQEPVQEAVETEVARQIAIAPDAPARPGTYTIQEAELNQALQANVGGDLDFDDMSAEITPGGITIEVDIQNQTATYEGDVIAENGRLQVVDMTADGGLTFFLPADNMADLLENGVNNYLDARGLRLSGVELGDGAMTLVVDPAA